ncbi:MAG: hypothetical protein INF12_14645 [Methylobacterium sp.]|nr:hypothetical protein [Methylobacterium sp.]
MPARETFVWCPVKRAVVPKAEREYTGGGLSVIRDHLDDIVNPADGKRYSSKRAYYAAVRAAGCEIVGNENLASVERNRPRIDGPGVELKRAFERFGL